jgi:tRNA threonylcarbamoyladenosine modification (KEOPS) complex  Pcc1 subunit
VHHAELRFDLASEKDAAAVAGALAVEEGPEGATADVRQEGATLHIRLQAGTLSDLRAALNTTVRLLDAASRTLAGASRRPPGRNG